MCVVGYIVFFRETGTARAGNAARRLSHFLNNDFDKKKKKKKLILSSSKPEDADANWHPQETLEQAIASVVKTDAGKMLIDKIKKGVTTYATENVTWTETSYATSVNAAPSDLAKIDSPAGNPPSISGNWRLTGTTAKKSESGRFWEITKTWTASDAGAKWDTDLYS